MQNEETENVPKPLPVWLSIPIILVCLGGGGWIIHWYVTTDPIAHETTLLGDAPAQASWQPNQRNNGGPGNRVRVVPGQPRIALQRRGIAFDDASGTMEMRTEKVRAMFGVQNGTATLRNIFFINAGFLPADAHKKILEARTLTLDLKRTEAMKLDVHQVAQLRALSGNLPMALSAADRSALLTAAQTYAADPNNRDTLEPKLLQQLDDIADRSIDATKQEAVDRAAQIDAIVTPDMWAQDAATNAAGK